MGTAPNSGLVAIVYHLIELGTRVSKRITDLSSAADHVPSDAVKKIKIDLPAIVDILRAIQFNIKSEAFDDETQSSLAQIINECLAETQRLDNILREALGPAVNATADRRKQAADVTSHHPDIQSIASSMSSVARNLSSRQVIDGLTSLNIEFSLPLGSPFWVVPHERNLFFVGRDKTLTEITNALAASDSQPRATLLGQGGMGKSQVALEYCYRLRNNDTPCSVFWVNAATVERFEESLKRIASACGFASKDDAGSNAPSLLKNYLETQHEGPWLMIIDNVDSKDTIFKEKMKIGQTPFEWLPKRADGSLLITTRSAEVAAEFAPPEKFVKLQRLHKDEGLQLVRERLGSDYSEDLVVELLDLLGYTPIAVNQAVSFMAMQRKSIQQYLEKYRSKSYIELQREQDFDPAQPAESLESVSKTWALSTESIRISNQRAADLLCLLNFFQHQGIPANLLQNEGEDDFDFEDATALLKDLSLITTNDAGSIVTTHRLVQVATQGWLEQETPQDVEKWAFAALKSVSTQFPHHDSHTEPGYFRDCEILLPHAEILLRYEFKLPTKDTELAKARLLNRTGRYLHWTGLFDEAKNRFKTSMEIYQEFLGTKHVDTLTSMGLLGWTLAMFDMSPEAVPILETVVADRRELVGEDHPTTIDALSDLATAIQQTGDTERAEVMHREAIERSEHVLGRKHSDTMNCVCHLASLLEDTGRVEEATRLQWEVYEVKKELLGPLHQDVLVQECNLARILTENEETHAQAIEFYQRNLEAKIQVYGNDHRETLVTAFNLAMEFYLKDRLDEALSVCRRSIEAAEDGPRKNISGSQDIVVATRRMVENIITEMKEIQLQGSQESQDSKELQDPAL